MPRNFSKYQYETSPRKIEPEYTPRQNPYKGKKKSTKKVAKTSKNNQQISAKKRQRKIIRSVAIGFVILFGLCYRNSQIDESFSKVQKLKDQVSSTEKQNAQLKVAIENSMNLSNVEQQAKELLGMQKLNSKQTVYVTLPKSDYVQPASESVVINEKKPLIQTITEKIGSLFK